MKFLLLGAGLQGTAIAQDLLKNAAGTTAVTVVDRDSRALERLRTHLNDPRLTTQAFDVTDQSQLTALMDQASVVISAVNYWLNVPLATLAVARRTHFLDLGGNNDVVRQELDLDIEARRQGVTVIPDCGLAPGMANILAYQLHGSFDEVDSLHIRVGGLPRQPEPPLYYQLSFAVQGLINEYLEPCVVIRDGEIQTVPGLTELETVRFPAPFGDLEAFQTSGGTSTLPQTLLGKVRHLDYKTIRYRGHCEKFRLLLELGMMDSEPVSFQGIEFAPRDFLGLILERSLTFTQEDVVLVSITAEGKAGGRSLQRSLRIIDTFDRENQISAMMRMTGYPAAIIAAMLAAGEIDTPGARPQELVVPAGRFRADLARRDIQIEENQESAGQPA